uniref:Uncharacterized protein AlNc14C139G7206 n=1 Tax=Albugo laibachii Nc14 TaxID=890382 RepID=F0WL17_9STRA|nr:conserved hypothetical protein [Albugo laibachii Nc14]|eukprot:CCA21976.1 conserved hypothetical protein [Albugo laibachii Nc14]
MLMGLIVRVAYLISLLTYVCGVVPTTCRIVQDFNHEKQNTSSEEQRGVEKDRIITEFLLTHPKETLWNYFKLENRRNIQNFGNLSLLKKLSHTVTDALDYIQVSSMDVIRYAIKVFQWVLLSFRHPTIGLSDVTVFFRDLRDNCVSLYTDMQHNATTENMAKGFLLQIARHPERFTANSVLMVSEGFAVVNGLIAGAQMLFQELSSSTLGVLLSVLLFMHTVNDPTIVIIPLLDRLAKTDDKIASRTRFSRALEPLAKCNISSQHARSLKISNLCLSSPRKVRLILFGTTKRVHTMSQAERTSAYNHMHNLICCYLKDQSFEIEIPELIDGFPTGKLVRKPVRMDKCQQHADNHPVELNDTKSMQSLRVESSYLRVVS